MTHHAIGKMISVKLSGVEACFVACKELDCILYKRKFFRKFASVYTFSNYPNHCNLTFQKTDATIITRSSLSFVSRILA